MAIRQDVLSDAIEVHDLRARHAVRFAVLAWPRTVEAVVDE
jgi:hypothetical protein